jgi:hypothetical protein
MDTPTDTLAYESGAATAIVRGALVWKLGVETEPVRFEPW